jgi:hypothetical protein
MGIKTALFSVIFVVSLISIIIGVSNIYNAQKNVDQATVELDKADANLINTCNQYATTTSQIARCNADITNMKIRDCSTHGEKLTICRPGGLVDQYLSKNR